jgi:RNA polymerase sigma-70 factor (ECF subfamily)
MRSYVYRTAENLIIDRWHDIQRIQGIADGRGSEPIDAPAPDVTSAMQRALSELDSKQQTLLWLAYVEGFDHKEIAAAANVGTSSVRVLLFRAKQKLLGILKDMGIQQENR